MSRTSILTRTMIIGMAGLVAVTVTGLAVVPALGTGAEGITNFTGNTTGSTVYSTNNGSGAAVEGVTGATGSGQAVYGIANNSLNAAFGIHGKVFGPSSTGLYGEAVNPDSSHPSVGLFGYSISGYGIFATTNNSAATGLFARNTGVGAGVGAQAIADGNAIVGQSNLSNGVVGLTGTGVAGAVAGVFGQDLAGSGTTNSGVVGISTNGTGVSGSSTSGVGVFGHSAQTNGINGTSAQGAGVRGFSAQRQGVLAVSGGGPTPPPSFTNFDIASLAVKGNGGSPLIIARGSGNTDVMSLDDSGNMILAGTLTPSSTPLIAHRQSSLGSGIGTYLAQQSAATVEDLGEANLVNGQAYVRIDPRFATLMDPRATYLVFITPQGQSRGSLYITQKSLSGFSVRENEGGHSSLAFDYRIVAKPVDASARRLPLMNGLPRATGYAIRPSLGSAAAPPHYRAGFIPKPLPVPPMILQSQRTQLHH